MKKNKRKSKKIKGNKMIKINTLMIRKMARKKVRISAILLSIKMR